MPRYKLALFLALTLVGCAPVPKHATPVETEPGITPDYRDVTIPSNIAPMNFHILEGGEDFITRLSAGSYSVKVKGRSVTISFAKWKRLLAAGTEVKVEVFCKKAGNWIGFPPFTWQKAGEIDSYLSYRLIPPSAVGYEELTLNQRDLTSFKERVIYSNTMVQTEENGQCINCHHFRNYKTDQMQFHARQYLGGTIIVRDGEVYKVNLKTDSTLSAGVYPAWHPTHDYIAYSTNQTKQSFHTANPNKTEVQDMASDLILYSLKTNEVSIIENQTHEFECFPAWSPDGRTLYFVSAHLEHDFSESRQGYLFSHPELFHYNLYKKSFNPDDLAWGEKELVIDAAAINKSITLPRVDPSGRFLIYAMGAYGVFHIWHRDADLYILDLQDGTARPLAELNSNQVESYHSWSSNGEWVVFSSRRDGTGYTRLYLSHHLGNGTFTKPFELPQRDPLFSKSLMYSYNIPEFTIEPVKVTPNEFAKTIKEGKVINAKFAKP